jgi:hypothetical protein
MWHRQLAAASVFTILRISSNIRTFRSVNAPPNKGGRARSINPIMLEALYEHLLEKPTLYLDEMTIFLWDEFDVQETKSQKCHPTLGHCSYCRHLIIIRRKLGGSYDN